MRNGIDATAHTLAVGNTAIQSFRRCPEKFHFGTQLGYSPIGQSDVFGSLDPGAVVPSPVEPPEFLFGRAIHKALDAMFTQQGLQPAIDVFLEMFQPVPDDPKRTPGRGVELLTLYWERHGKRDDIGITAVQCETKFTCELGQLSLFDSSHWTIYYVGIIDKILTYTDKSRKLMDHKTSTFVTNNTALVYELESQFIGYVWAAQQKLGFPDIDTIIADILLMNPKNNDVIRTDITCNDERIARWYIDTMQTCRWILECFATDHWPMYGSHACIAFNRLCPYFDICQSDMHMHQIVIDASYRQHIRELEDLL